MNIEQAIEQWLNLCPCKDLIIKNESGIFWNDDDLKINKSQICRI